MASNEIVHMLKTVKDKEVIKAFLKRQSRPSILSLFNYLSHPKVDKATHDRWMEVYSDMFSWRNK